MARVIDISLPLGPDLLVWPGNPPVSLHPIRRLADGADAEVHELRMSTHGGTHVDAPGHVVAGAPTIETTSLEALVGPCLVIDLPGVERVVHVAELATCVPEGTTRILLRTRNSSLWEGTAGTDGSPAFPENYVSLGLDAASWLVDRGVLLVGTDFLGIEERGAAGRPVHRALVDGGVTIVEGLDLRDAPPGRYLLACLPLRLVGADGAPARAVLIERDGAWA